MRRERREFSEYAAQRGVGLSYNGLYPDTNVALACGRGPVDVDAAGDEELAGRTVAGFNIAP